ncbi:MAG: hypothetical protein QM698_10770 [Micropepsaceae bacterium]
MDARRKAAQPAAAMEIFAANGLAIPRFQPSPSVTAYPGERIASLSGSTGQSTEVKQQQRQAADASTFVAAQNVQLVNGILGVEGAVAGTSIDVRV